MNNSDGLEGVSLKITIRFKTINTNKTKSHKTRGLIIQMLHKYLVIESNNKTLLQDELNLWRGPRCMKRIDRHNLKPNWDRTTSIKGIAVVEFHKVLFFLKAIQICITKNLMTRTLTTILIRPGHKATPNFQSSNSKLQQTAFLTTNEPLDVISPLNWVTILKSKI